MAPQSRSGVGSGCEMWEPEAGSLQLAARSYPASSRGVSPFWGSIGSSPSAPWAPAPRGPWRGDWRSLLAPQLPPGHETGEAEDAVQAGALGTFAWVALCPSRFAMFETACWWRPRC